MAKRRATRRKTTEKPAGKRRASRPARRAKRRSSAAARSELPNWVAPGMLAVNTHLTVGNIERALGFYEKAFGFKRQRWMPGPDGDLMHAELTHEGCVVMLGLESDQSRLPAEPSNTIVDLYVYVKDVDSVASRTREAGGTVTDEPKDQFWGDRTAVVVDPDGHRWTLATFKKLVPLEDVPSQIT